MLGADCLTFADCSFAIPSVATKYMTSNTTEQNGLIANFNDSESNDLSSKCHVSTRVVNSYTRNRRSGDDQTPSIHRSDRSPMAELVERAMFA